MAITLRYFPLRALAEPTKITLEYGNVPYTEEVIQFAEWGAGKKKDPEFTVFGQVYSPHILIRRLSSPASSLSHPPIHRAGHVHVMIDVNASLSPWKSPTPSHLPPLLTDLLTDPFAHITDPFSGRHDRSPPCCSPRANFSPSPWYCTPATATTKPHASQCPHPQQSPHTTHSLPPPHTHRSSCATRPTRPAPCRPSLAPYAPHLYVAPLWPLSHQPPSPTPSPPRRSLSQMPVMDGIECARRFRAYEVRPRCPPGNASSLWSVPHIQAHQPLRSRPRVAGASPLARLDAPSRPSIQGHQRPLPPAAPSLFPLDPRRCVARWPAWTRPQAGASRPPNPTLPLCRVSPCRRPGCRNAWRSGRHTTLPWQGGGPGPAGAGKGSQGACPSPRAAPA